MILLKLILISLQEEWERALQDLAARYDREPPSKAKDEIIRQLTVKRYLR